MSAKFGCYTGGGGDCRLLGPDTGGSGGSTGYIEPTDEELREFSAKRLVSDLNLPDAEFKPEQTQLTFPGPIAEAYYWSDADIVGIQGPVGSGKTTTKMRRKLRRAREMMPSVIDGVRRYKVIFCRHTYRQLWSTTIPSYLEAFPKSWGEWSGGRGDPVTHRISFDDGDGPIEFIAEFMAFGDDLIAAMRGLETTDLDLNEADTMPVEILSVGLGRIKRWPGQKHLKGLPEVLANIGQIDCDFNAPDEENWCFDLFHDEEKRAEILEGINAQLEADGAKVRVQIEFFNQPGYQQEGCENLQNLKAGYYPSQLAANKLVGRGDLNARLVFNQITHLKIGDPVFEREFNPSIHVAKSSLPVLAEFPLLVGLDQGFKGAAVICQKTPYQWRIYEVVFFPKERLFAKVFGQRLGDILDGPRYGHITMRAGWGDMAGEHGASQAATENATWNRIVSQVSGLPIRPQRIGTNRIQPRLEAVRAGLEAPLHGGQPGLILDPLHAKPLIVGFQARYVWAEEIDASGDKRKVPNKSIPEANPMDALQYVMLTEVKGDGTSPNTSSKSASGPSGRRPKPPEAQGLINAHNIYNPYGD